MTECPKQLSFGFCQDRQLTCDFKGGRISSDTGLLAVRELEAKLGWLAETASVLSDPRDPDRTEHGLVAVLHQRMPGIVAGYEDCNDHDRMRQDPVLKLSCGQRPAGGPLASQPTLSRLENWMSALDLARLNRLPVGRYIALHSEEPPEEIILDVDITDDAAPGVRMQFGAPTCQVAFRRPLPWTPAAGAAQPVRRPAHVSATSGLRAGHWCSAVDAPTARSSG